MKHIKNSKLIIFAIILAMILAVLTVLLIDLESNQEDPFLNTTRGDVDPTETSALPRPWDSPGAKQPADYTWEEFLALSPELQIVFQNAMGADAFEEWMKNKEN